MPLGSVRKTAAEISGAADAVEVDVDVSDAGSVINGTGAWAAPQRAARVESV
jgi:hypothetical protein